MLDWVPTTRDWIVWPYDRMAISEDPLPEPAIKEGTWKTIGSGHTLLYFGGDMALDWVPAIGDYRVFRSDWSQQDFLPGPARSKGAWATIRDMVIGEVASEHRLVYLGGDHVLDWVPQDRSYRVWHFDRHGTRQDPLLGRIVMQADGTKDEQPFAEGVFPDPEVNSSTSILAIDMNEILVWHADTGKYRVWFYDRIGLQPETFSASNQQGTWNTIRVGHVLLWLGELGSGQLLDWEPATGKYRLFNDVPSIA